MRSIAMILVPLIFAAALPVDLWFISWAFRRLIDEQPMWVIIGTSVAFFLTFFGFATLVDRQERKQKQ